MDWATAIAAEVQASLEGGPYISDDVERIAAALRAERAASASLADSYGAWTYWGMHANAAAANAAAAEIAAAIHLGRPLTTAEIDAVKTTI